MLTQSQNSTLSKHGFSLLKFLDDGSFASVIAASDARRGGLTVAIKIVDKAIVVKHKKCEAIMTEKAVMGRLDHANILQLLETFHDSENFVTEWCQLGNLLQWRSSLPTVNDVSLCKSIMAQLIAGISYLHSQGILHRDLKPENLLLTAQMVLKIGDFGSALVLSSSKDDDSTELNRFVGTPEYMSPELVTSQVRDAQSAKALDWWAAGCTGFWLLTGRVLFEAGTEYLTFKAIEMGPPLRAIKECCDVDETLGEIIIGLLKRDVQRRLEFVEGRLKELLALLER